MQFHLHFNPVEILCWVELHYISSCSTDCVISSFLFEMSRLRESGRLVWSFDLSFAQIFANRSERDGKLWQKEYVRRFGRTTGREITSNQSPRFLYGFTQLKYTNSFVSSEARLFGYSLPRALYAKTSANKIKNLTEVRWTLELKVESKKSICGAMSLFHVGCEMNSMNGWRGTTVTDEKRKNDLNERFSSNSFNQYFSYARIPIPSVTLFVSKSCARMLCSVSEWGPGLILDVATSD